MGAVRSSLLSRAGDLLVRWLSALLLSRTELNKRFPEDVQHVLAGAEVIDLYALDPEDHQDEQSPGRFHGYGIIGQVTVQDAGERSRIGRVLAEGNTRAGGSFL